MRKLLRSLCGGDRSKTHTGRRARLAVERLGDRLVTAGLVSVTVDDGTLVVRGTDGDESIGIDYPDPSSIRVFALDPATSVGGPGLISATVPKTAINKEWDIDLGWGPDLVRVQGLVVPYDLNIREAQVDLDTVGVSGEARFRAETSREHSAIQPLPNPVRPN